MDFSSLAPQQLQAGDIQFAATNQEPDLTRIDKALHVTATDLADCVARLHQIANDLFGPPPPSAARDDGIPVVVGSVNKICERCAALGRGIDDLRLAISRLSRL